MIFRNFDEMIGVAKIGGRRRIAIARAEDPLVLEGVLLAYQEELVEPVLFGDAAKIRALLDEGGLPDWRIENCDGDDKACSFMAIEAVKRGDADLLMKGHMHTGTLFSAVLDHDRGLERHGILSHIAFVQIAAYPKLFGTTDGGLTLAPSFEQKVELVRNTVRAFHNLGYEQPKIGLLSYVEKVNPRDPETSDWGKISEMAKAGEFGHALVEGPLAMDLCLSREAKEIKGIDSQVSADVDAIVAPNITACNASTKALVVQGGQAAGIVVGANVPIVALSRGDSPRTRLCSMATGIAMLPRK